MASRWVQKWTELVPKLMGMKADAEKENDELDRPDNSSEEFCIDAPERGENFQDQLGMPDEGENRRLDDLLL